MAAAKKEDDCEDSQKICLLLSTPRLLLLPIQILNLRPSAWDTSKKQKKNFFFSFS